MNRGGPLARRTPLKARVGLKSARRGLSPRRKVSRAKLPTTSSVRRKCDALLTPIIKAQHPFCLLCPNRTEVAHHHVHKSKSTALRYYLPNLVNLCHHCHQRLHHNESYWASKVVQIRGIEWFNDLERKKDVLVKADVHFYMAQHARLSAIGA